MVAFDEKSRHPERDITLCNKPRGGTRLRLMTNKNVACDQKLLTNCVFDARRFLTEDPFRKKCATVSTASTNH